MWISFVKMLSYLYMSTPRSLPPRGAVCFLSLPFFSFLYGPVASPGLLSEDLGVLAWCFIGFNDISSCLPIK